MLGTTAVVTGSIRAFAAALALIVALLVPPGADTGGGGGGPTRVIVRAVPSLAGDAVAAVEHAGGTVVRTLPSLGGLVADLPAQALPFVAGHRAVAAVTPDTPIRLQHEADGFDQQTSAGSLWSTTAAVGARAYWAAGYTGAGIDVALIDSGVTAVEGLATPGKLVHGADLSFDSQDETTRYVDRYGHGTHMAGIIGGRDGAAADGGLVDDHHSFLGMAPDARLVNVKVADGTGAVDVSQVIAAIDWVVQHRRDNGLDIRVLALAFGTDGAQSWQVDPLAFAVEVAWRNGIFVAVAAGNDGRRVGPLRNPASDPWVMAVAAGDTRGTVTVDDDVVPAFSNRGDSRRDPDVTAPGVSVVSLRAPGSEVDSYPSAFVAERFVRGTGTSQATAVVAGAAALVLQQRPGLAPDQVKALLTSTARRIPNHGRTSQGSGLVALDAALGAPVPAVNRTIASGSGGGSLEQARGTVHLLRDGVELTGERDIFGAAFEAPSWARLAAAGSSWSGGTWNGSTWSGSSWSGSSWSGSSWSGGTWSGSTWSGGWR